MKDSTRNHIVQLLEEALQVTYSAPKRKDYGYSYATGYCQSAMKIVLGMIREESK